MTPGGRPGVTTDPDGTTPDPSPVAADRCGCDPRFEDGSLVLDAEECPGGGDLAGDPACRTTAVGALADRDARAVRTAVADVERVYAPRTVALLVAAGRFADAVAAHDGRLARTARRDPLAAAARATARSGRVAELAAETGLALVAERLAGTTDPFAVERVRFRPTDRGRGDRS